MAVLTAGTVVLVEHVTLTRLEQHALTDQTGTHRLVTRRGRCVWDEA